MLKTATRTAVSPWRCRPLPQCRRSNRVIFLCYLLGLLADACPKAGRHAEAMKAVEDGLVLAEATGERFYSAELHRLHGELLARPPHGQKRKAEASFRTAIKVAKQQGATALEHKAIESLRHWSG